VLLISKDLQSVDSTIISIVCLELRIVKPALQVARVLLLQVGLIVQLELAAEVEGVLE